MAEQPAPLDAAPAAEPVDPELEARVARCLQIGPCIQEDELRRLLKNKPLPRCYDGFEPSGRMHIAQGVLKAINVNRLTESGCRFTFWVADWFALLNDKLGGDLKKIRDVGLYMIEIWRAVGMNLDQVEFLWASDEINKHSDEYWSRVMDIARLNNIARIKRCSKIMGRLEGDELSAAQIMYPCMQCADIFFLKADICQLGLDQLKVNVLAREYCTMKKIKLKPVIISHPMLMGLIEGQQKMSKSNPDSAIFMEDTEAEVARKIKRAFCPPCVLENNPCVDYVRNIVFPARGKLLIQRNDANGGNREYTSLGEFEEDYRNGALHPGDLKPALTKVINELIAPVRKHFETNETARELKKRVDRYVNDERKKAASKPSAKEAPYVEIRCATRKFRIEQAAPETPSLELAVTVWNGRDSTARNWRRPVAGSGAAIGELVGSESPLSAPDADDAKEEVTLCLVDMRRGFNQSHEGSLDEVLAMPVLAEFLAALTTAPA